MPTYVITEWDGSTAVVEVLFGPQPEMEMDSDDVRIIYEDGACEKIKKEYFLQLNPVLAQ
jgi:hypothetical protein